MRNSTSLLIGIAAMFMALIAPELAHAQGPLVLVANGKAKCTIVIPYDADSFTRMAAGWLVDYVKRVSGAELRVVSESATNPEVKASVAVGSRQTGNWAARRLSASQLALPRGTLISIGHTKLAARAGIDTKGLKYDGSRMVVRGRVLYLLGPDSAVRGGAIPRPKEGPWLYHYETEHSNRDLALGPKGTCRAVTSFLEDFCGIRWLAPTSKGVLVPKRNRIEVPADLDRKFSPAFASWVGSFYGTQVSRPAAYANNVRCAIRMRHYGGHSYHAWFSPGLFKQHPEYFIMYNGQRTNVGHHLCASNPQVRRILLRGLQATFDAGYDWVEMGQSDGHKPCECNACRKMDPDPGRRLLKLHQWICAEAAKSHPDNTVMMLVYGPTRKAHDDIKFGDNVVIEMTSGHPDQFKEWKGQGRGIMVYIYWLDETWGMGWGPRMSPADAAQIISFYSQNDVIAIYGPGSGRSWGLMGPTHYVLGKMMGDPSLDHRELVKEYCAGLYGPAAEDMVDFFNTLYTRSYWQAHHMGGMPLNIPEAIRYLYPPLLIQGLDERLARAEQAADSERARMWIQMTRDEFDYLKHMSNVLALYDGYLVDRSPAIFAELKAAVGKFNVYRRRVVMLQGQRITDYFPGHGFLAKFLSSGANSGGYYSFWGKVRTETDLSRLDRSGVGFRAASAMNIPLSLDFSKPGGGLEFRLARTSRPPLLDGKLSEPAWRRARPTIFKGSVATRVRGLYDDQNLYISFECDEPNIGRLHVKDFYRDGDVSAMDCVEFMVCPESSVYATRYYHFLLAPAKNALLDLRTGFKADLWQDEAWNAEGLKYAYTINRQGRRWTIEMMIPLKDIKASPPKPGTVWMGNLGRERRAGVGELLLWSQKGSSGFTSPAAFGRFVFE